MQLQTKNLISLARRSRSAAWSIGRSVKAGLRRLRRREDDYERMHRLVKREADYLAHPSVAVNPKRVVIYCMDYAWPLGVVELFLHHAVRLKGHRSTVIKYDGLLPVGPFENLHTAPPSPAACQALARRAFESFGIEPTGTSDYLDGAAAAEQAAHLVAGLSREELVEFAYRGLPVGKLALRDLFQFTLGHFEPQDAERLELYRRHVIHGVMSVDLAHAVLERERPDVLVLVNGKTVSYSYLYEVCRQMGVEVTTWEEGMYHDTSIVLANNERAIDFPIRAEEWADCQARDIPQSELERVDEYFGRWRRQEATAYVYYSNEVTDFDEIRRELGIAPDQTIISMFPNIVWDSNAIGKDRAFESMMDWVFSTIELAGTLPSTTLVIRSHPGEVRLRVKTRTCVKDLIEQRYGSLPSHVRVVENTSELSSYEIARRSSRCLVYTSTLGIEFSLMGLRPLICGVPFYAGKGLTNDIASREQFQAILRGEQEPQAVDCDLLRRFMYLTIFEFVQCPEFLQRIDGHPQNVRFGLSTFREFPQSLPVFNRIVDAILERKSFVHSKH